MRARLQPRAALFGLANCQFRGGYATCGGDNAVSIFGNHKLQGCYSPRLPGPDATSPYVAPPNAGYNANGTFIGIVPDSAASPSRNASTGADSNSNSDPGASSTGNNDNTGPSAGSDGNTGDTGTSAGLNSNSDTGAGTTGNTGPRAAGPDGDAGTTNTGTVTSVYATTTVVSTTSVFTTQTAATTVYAWVVS